MTFLHRKASSFLLEACTKSTNQQLANEEYSGMVEEVKLTTSKIEANVRNAKHRIVINAVLDTFWEHYMDAFPDFLFGGRVSTVSRVLERDLALVKDWNTKSLEDIFFFLPRRKIEARWKIVLVSQGALLNRIMYIS